MKFEIKNWWTGAVQYSCELDAEIAGKSYGIQLGFAVKKALADGSNLRGSNLSGSDLRGSNLRDSDLSKCPVKIDNIHSAVYAAASAPWALNMREWHACETTHCRAGWVVALAGEGGRALEFACGTATAAAMIYLASDPGLERIPDFYCGNAAALDDMRRLAEVEKAA